MLVFPIYVIQDTCIYIKNFHYSFLGFLLQLIACWLSLWELSIVLKQQHRHRIVAKHSHFLTFFNFSWTKYPSHSSTTEHSLGSNTTSTVEVSGTDADRDPGLGTEQQHRGEPDRWLPSHSIIQPISQAHNRARWKWQAGKPCSGAPLQRSAASLKLWQWGCVRTINRHHQWRISNNKVTKP